MSFERDIQKFKQKAKNASEATIRAAGLQVFAAIIERTPVGNPEIWLAKNSDGEYVDYLSVNDYPEGYIGGTARGNWQTAVGRRPTGTLDTQDESGRVALAGASLAAASFTLADTLYFANNLPYIQRLEDGWSSQAPAGMVANSVDSFSRAVDGAARKHRI
ncbi:MAG: hypothetical protein R3215_02165 [Halomonas sp.]|nr:hypothetical protein [Halomonas sp.]